jgi:Tetratricopeptide repeat
VAGKFPASGGGAGRRRPARWAGIFLVLVGMVTLEAAARAQTKARVGASPEAVRVESSPQLFAVLAALDAAGFESNESSRAFAPWIEPLREDLRERKGPAVEALREYYAGHLLGTAGETLSQYVSFALVAGPPPDFAIEQGEGQLPPDARAIADFRPVLANFYREQHLNREWAEVEPRYRQLERRLVPAVSQMVLVSAGYLREMVPASGERTFTVYVEPLVGSVVNARLYGEHYAIVVSAVPRAPLDQIGHAFLHFLLDPLPLGHRDLVMAKQPVLNFAARAPRLPEAYKSDFLALADECLVQAVELRLRKLAPAEVRGELDLADRAGYVLVRPIYERLAAFERSTEAMEQFFPELMKGIDLGAELRRDAGIRFDPAERPARAGKAAQAADELAARLERGDREIAEGKAPAAATTFESVLAKDSGNQRALYGLAVASVLLGNGERAEKLFERVVAGESRRKAPGDAMILAWSHVYLGRMRDLEGSRQKALDEYHGALEVDGAPEAARLAARRGLEVPYAPPAGRSEHSSPP